MTDRKALAEKLEEWRQWLANGGTFQHDADRYSLDCDLDAAATALREEGEPLRMYLCEASRVVLKPQAYRFVVDPDCDLCIEAEKEAYGGHPHTKDESE